MRNTSLANVSLDYVFGQTITPILPEDLVNKNYVDDAVSSTAFDFFFSNSTSDISGHFNMTEPDLDRAENTLDSTSLGTGTIGIFNWTTLIGQPEFNELRKGVYDVHVHLNVNGVGRKPVTITPKLYNISADGLVRTLLVTFETSDTLTSSLIEYDLHGVLGDNIMLDDGVRLNLELEADVGVGGADVTVTTTMEGTTDSHLSIETSTNAFEQIFIRRDGTNTLVGNWNFDTPDNPFNINGSGNITTTGTVQAEHLYSTDDAVIDDDLRVNGALGVGTAPSSHKVNINAGTITDDVRIIKSDGTFSGITTLDVIGYDYTQHHLNEDITGAIYGNFYTTFLDGDTTTPTLFGFYTRPYMRSSGTINDFIGFSTDPYFNGADATGNINTVVGIQARSGFYGGGATSSITNWRQLDIWNPHPPADITNAYGLYMAEITSGSSLNYQIYSVAGDTFFGNGEHEFVGTIDVSGTGEFGDNVLINKAVDGGDVNLTISNTASGGSSDETVTLFFKHKGIVGGKIVNVRENNFAPATENSGFEFWVTSGGSNQLALTLDSSMDAFFKGSINLLDNEKIFLGDAQDKSILANDSGMFFTTEVGDTPYFFDNNLIVSGNVTVGLSEGKLWSNTTCTFIESPNGGTVLEICNP